MKTVKIINGCVAGGLFLGTLLSGQTQLPPGIAKQPTNQFASLGAQITFSVTAIGTAPFNYFWFFNDTAIAGATLRSLVITNIQPVHAGGYSVVITNAYGSITSQVAILAVDKTFTKITTGPVVNDTGGWEAPTWWDINNDGFLDLYIAQSSLTSDVYDVLYLNNGNGTFTRVTNAITLRLRRTFAGAVADYNSDGNEDLLAIHMDGADDLYRSDGGGIFTRLTGSQAGLPFTDADNSVDAGWADIDRDGFLELFIANGYNTTGNDCLYRYDANGFFTKLTASQVGILVADNAATGPCAWVDYDKDGYPDLWVGSGWSNPASGRQYLWHNNGNGTFSPVSAGSLVNNLAGALGLWADYDNDGYPDLFLTSWAGTNSLHRNLGGKTFSDVSKEAGVARMMGAWAADWGDYDNDGCLDLIVIGASSANQSMLYRNNGDGTFTSVDIGSPLREGERRIGVAWADYDNDGSLDLLITCGDAEPAGKNLLYHNNGNSNHWIQVKLVGTASNRSAIGAKVRVTATIGGKTVLQMREISGNSGSSGGAGGLRAHFGLGDATSVDLVRIEWPSGTVQELNDVAPRQLLTVTEPCRLETAGTGQFKICCWKGMAFTVETSADLSAGSWTGTATVTNITGTLIYTIPDVTSHSPQFYRVKHVKTP